MNKQGNQTLCIEELVKQRPVLTESEMSEFCTYDEIVADFKTTFDNMVKESIDKVVTEITNDSREPLLEMARIDDPQKDAKVLGTKEIWVYGNDRTSKAPHFHYLDVKSKPIFEVEIRIEDLTICKSKPRLGVSKNRLLSWDGIADAKKALDIWLNQHNNDVSSLTNYDMLKVTWNQNNRDNPV